MSAPRTSTVGWRIDGRTFQYRCEASSAIRERTSAVTVSSYVARPPKTAGIPVTGQRANHWVRKLAYVDALTPSQNGELPDSASSAGRSGRSRSRTCTASSGSGTETSRETRRRN